VGLGGDSLTAMNPGSRRGGGRRRRRDVGARVSWGKGNWRSSERVRRGRRRAAGVAWPATTSE
jgi:hypothetical protein